jgi:hypothetical protein
MTVYVRTEEGQLAAYSPDSALPRKMRSLLKVIDGKTTVDVYTNSLKAFGDVQGVLKSLDMAGLIRPMSQLPPGAVRAAEAAQTSGQASGANTVWGTTKSNLSRSSQASTFKASQVNSNTQAGFKATRNADSMMSRNDPSTDLARSQALARAVDAMANFVLLYTPEHSFVILKELEQMSNLEQLAVTLGGYEQMISHVGAPAADHISMIKKLLRLYL